MTEREDENEEGVAREEHVKRVRVREVDGGVTFANYVLSDWDQAMDHFFRKVELASERLDITAEEVRQSLRMGYGDDIADAWDEWLADE